MRKNDCPQSLALRNAIVVKKKKFERFFFFFVMIQKNDLSSLYETRNLRFNVVNDVNVDRVAVRGRVTLVKDKTQWALYDLCPRRQIRESC